MMKKNETCIIDKNIYIDLTRIDKDKILSFDFYNVTLQNLSILNSKTDSGSKIYGIYFNNTKAKEIHISNCNKYRWSNI